MPKENKLKLLTDDPKNFRPIVIYETIGILFQRVLLEYLIDMV